MKNYEKVLVIDYDHTISMTKGTDFENAKPVPGVIEKINELYNKGWIIKIYTARGHISCDSRVDARYKYEKRMRQWLSDNNVKYHTLSFNKPLAKYYIDDKAIRPDEFAKMTF